MSDNLSYVLAKHNYNVSKYVPYGPVKDAIPYLIRRAKKILQLPDRSAANWI
jgi:proline dehydrogenase